jgi:glycosyltransferase involved in cell wall biosynthesis
LGYLKREEIIAYVSHAHILVMVRSNNQEAKASYPSKLSEFLASSKPVITVNVGEIPLYISDGINAFMVEPENADALAEKLEYVLLNYEFAIQVGKNGKELTDTVFNYNFQAKRMLEFINSLN